MRGNRGQVATGDRSQEPEAARLETLGEIGRQGRPNSQKANRRQEEEKPQRGTRDQEEKKGGERQGLHETEELSRAKRTEDGPKANSVRPADAGRGQKPNHRTTEPLGGALTKKVRTEWFRLGRRGKLRWRRRNRLENLALYAGNLGEAHAFEEILAAAPYLPGDWTIRFAARGAKLAALKAAASGMRHTAEGIRSEGRGPGGICWAGEVCRTLLLHGPSIPQAKGA